MNFKLVNITNNGTVEIGKDNKEPTVNIENKRSNDGWFWDDPEPKVNSFKVGGGEGEGEKLLFGKFMDFVLPQGLKGDFDMRNA